MTMTQKIEVSPKLTEGMQEALKIFYCYGVRHQQIIQGDEPESAEILMNDELVNQGFANAWNMLIDTAQKAEGA